VTDAAQLKVLVVDDEPLVGQLVASLLQRRGYPSVVMDSAQAALDAAAAENFGLVITDMQMPGYGGVRLCKELQKRYPEVPVIAMSGSGPLRHNPDLQKALKAGARSVIAKPFELRQFYAAIAEALAERV
jgi:CheY-like chemotaxis protein